MTKSRRRSRPVSSSILRKRHLAETNGTTLSNGHLYRFDLSSGAALADINTFAVATPSDSPLGGVNRAGFTGGSNP